MGSNGFITVTDDSDEPRVDLILTTSPQLEDHGKLQLDLVDFDLPYKPKPEVAAIDLKNSEASIDDLMSAETTSPNDSASQAAYGSATNGHSEQTQAVLDDAASGSKRKRQSAEGVQLAQKRAKPETVDVDEEPDATIRVDGNNGAILLDDD